MNYQYGQNFELKDYNSFILANPGEWINIRLPKANWKINNVPSLLNFAEETQEENLQIFSFFVKEVFNFDGQYHQLLLQNDQKKWLINIKIVSG